MFSDRIDMIYKISGDRTTFPNPVNAVNPVYDKMVSSVAPKQARGYTWFGFYGASNEYNEPITVTATVEVEKEDEKEIPNIAGEYRSGNSRRIR